MRILLPIALVAGCLFRPGTVPASEPLAQPMRFVRAGNSGNCDGCEWIAATGVITEETPDVLERFLGQRPGPAPLIVLHSPGGDVRAAVEIGMMLRERGIDASVGETVVAEPREDGSPGWQEVRSGQCLSACVFALVGGKRRFLDDGAAVGVHQFYHPHAIRAPDVATLSAADAAEQQELMGWLIVYLQRMGIDPYLLHLAAETPPRDIRILDRETLAWLGIDNTSGVQQTDWRLEPALDGVIARVETRRGADEPRRLIFLCRAERPFLMLSMALDGGPGHARDVAAAIAGISLLLDGGPLRPAMSRRDRDVEIWHDEDGDLHVTVALSDGEWQRIRNSAGTLRLSIDLPRAYGFSDGAGVALEDAGRFLDVARRNCITED